MPQRGAYGVGLDTCCMVEVDPERFEVMVSDALDGIPAELGELMSNVAVTVQHDSGPAGLLGLYQGVPLTRRSTFYAGALPDRITIYRRAICAVCNSDSAIRSGVGVSQAAPELADRPALRLRPRRGLLSLPVEWTDGAAEDPFVAVAAGRSPLRTHPMSTPQVPVPHRHAWGATERGGATSPRRRLGPRASQMALRWGLSWARLGAHTGNLVTAGI